MLNATLFFALVKLDRKLANGEVLSAGERRLASTYKVRGPKVCGHEGCTNPLGPRVDGERHKIGGVEVCEDCYFEAFGQLERFPIGVAIHRAHGCGLID
jgi:hypothetical protein